MLKRPISIIILVVTFLLSAWGNVIAAAFCPRYLSHGGCHLKLKPRQTEQIVQKSCHEMSDMEMGDMQMDETDADVYSSAETADIASAVNQPIEIAQDLFFENMSVELPTEGCTRCWMHSQPASGIATIVAVDPSNRLIETNAPPTDLTITLPSALPVPVLQRGHGPPGSSSPRHVLINVFRI